MHLHHRPALQPNPQRSPASYKIQFPDGFAWPARDQRIGTYVVCWYASPLSTLSVVDDFGDLVTVPCHSFSGCGTVLQLIDFAEGTH